MLYADMQAEKAIKLLLPNDEYRRVSLSLLLEVLREANSYGSDKWGIYYYNNGIRFLIGNLIVFTIHKDGIWMALDKQLLDQLDEKRQLLELSDNWRWDTHSYPEYILIPSKNGYYTPAAKSLQLWPVIRPFHFSYINKAANKYKKLNIKSQLKFTPNLLSYMRLELEEEIPSPSYNSLITDPIQDIEGFLILHRELPNTERESLVRSRIGQGQFRIGLIKYWQYCAVTGCKATEILKASHIKPWCDSDNRERLDIYNGLLLIPNLDSVFDKGLISFHSDGRIIISSLLSDSDRNRLNIYLDMRLRKVEEEHHRYLQYHREKVFRS